MSSYLSIKSSPQSLEVQPDRHTRNMPDLKHINSQLIFILRTHSIIHSRQPTDRFPRSRRHLYLCNGDRNLRRYLRASVCVSDMPFLYDLCTYYSLAGVFSYDSMLRTHSCFAMLFVPTYIRLDSQKARSRNCTLLPLRKKPHNKHTQLHTQITCIKWNVTVVWPMPQTFWVFPRNSQHFSHIPAEHRAKRERERERKTIEHFKDCCFFNSHTQQIHTNTHTH